MSYRSNTAFGMLPREGRRRTGRFSLKLKLPTNDIVEIKSVEMSSKVSSIKLYIEKEFGIPCFLQRLNYLDAVDLPDHTNLQHSDVVPGGTIRLSTWSNWDLFLCSALRADLRRLLAEGDVLGMDEWHKKRAWTLMYVSAHYGHFEILLRMLGTGTVDVNQTTDSGRTALHAAAYRGHWKCLCALLEKGADITVTDIDGCTALDLSRIGSNETCRQCEKSLNFCAWNLQKKKIAKRDKDRKPSLQVLRFEGERKAHQYADSSLHPWFKGEYAQVYLARPPNPVSLPAQRNMRKAHGHLKSLSTSTQFTGTLGITLGISPTETCNVDNLDIEHKINKNAEDSEWFDPHRAKEFVPSGRDLLAYSEEALHQNKHIPDRVVPSPASLLPPKRTPSPSIFGRRSVHSRTDSRSGRVSVSDGLDFVTWFTRKGEEWKKEIAESKEREKQLRETVVIEKRRRNMKAQEAFDEWLLKKNSQPKPATPEEETAANRVRSRARHLTAVR